MREWWERVGAGHGELKDDPKVFGLSKEVGKGRRGREWGSGRFGVNFRSSVCDLLRWSCSLAIQVEMWQGRQLDQLESGRGAARARGGYLQSTVLCFVQTRSADEVLSKGLPTWPAGPREQHRSSCGPAPGH